MGTSRTSQGSKQSARVGDSVEKRGLLLVAIPRGKPLSNGSYREEFRVALDEYNGSQFLNLRLFGQGQDGRMFPVPGKGCSVRLSEAEDVARALLEGVRIADSPGGLWAEMDRQAVEDQADGTGKIGRGV
jgi:hypothetical protein